MAGVTGALEGDTHLLQTRRGTHRPSPVLFGSTGRRAARGQDRILASRDPELVQRATDGKYTGGSSAERRLSLSLFVYTVCLLFLFYLLLFCILNGATTRDVVG